MRSMLLGALLVIACSRTPQELASQDAPQKPAATSTATTSSTPLVEAPPLTPSDLAEPWNPKGIDWKSYDEGLAIASKEKKPICLILYGTWCEHCRNYSHVFGDLRLVRRSKDFVMVRVDVDANDAVSKKYSPDGAYVPRTFILDSAGNINPEGHSDHPRYAHFFDEMHADSLLDVMDRVLAPVSR